MALSVSPSLRIKPQTGQAAPRNEVGANEVFAGGAFSLVDRGSGDLAWQFSGTGGPNDTKAVIGSAYAMTPTNGGTLAVTLRILTGPTVDFTKYVAFANAGVTNGIKISQNGAGNIRVVTTDDSSTSLTTAIGAAGTTDVTYVIRIGAAQDVWVTTAGRSGTAPNLSTAIGAFMTATLTTFLLRGDASDLIQVKDVLFCPGKLTNTECANLADNFRATADAAAGATINLTGAACTQAATCSTGAVTVTPAVAGVVNLAGSSCTQAATCSTGAVAVTAATATITTEPFRNWSRQLQANLTIPHVVALRLSDRAPVLSLANQVTNSSGVLALTSSALVAGTDYMLATFSADGLIRGFKKYTAA